MKNKKIQEIIYEDSPDCLFSIVQVKRYFNILYSLCRYTTKYYPNKRCQKEIFIQRTIGKWFKERYFCLKVKIPTGFIIKDKKFGGYNEYEEYKTEAKIYLQVLNIQFILGYGDVIAVYYDNATGFDGKKLEISHNDALRLEGWEISEEEFTKINDLFKV